MGQAADSDRPTPAQEPAGSDDARVRALATFMQLESEARQAASAEALQFVVVNETRRLINYRQAMLWHTDARGRVRILRVSGAADVSPEAPYVRWLQKVLQAAAPATPGLLQANSLPEALAGDWQRWFTAAPLALPFARDGSPAAGMLLCRDGAWDESEISLCTRLADAYAHAWYALTATDPVGSRLAGLLAESRTRLLLLAVLAAAMLLPVHQTVLAPAQVVPRDPVIITSPMSGVINSFAVEANQAVHAGQLLFRLDDTELRAAHQVATRSLEVMRSDLMRASQKAFGDDASKAEIAILQAQVDLREAELQHTARQLERIEVRAELEGIVIFADANDWIGKPVQVGEKVMINADSETTRLRIDLPVDDAIALEPGARVRLFLNTDPTQPLEATLTHTSYEPGPTPAGSLAFALKASFNSETQPPRVGLKGTAKVYGEKVTLFHYLFRRPLSALRRFTGW